MSAPGGGGLTEQWCTRQATFRGPQCGEQGGNFGWSSPLERRHSGGSGRCGGRRQLWVNLHDREDIMSVLQ
jgi:hypothetical protein